MHEFSTPMMKQYHEIKKQYQDCLLFYRMGDFYELFMDDALVGSQVLNITLTSKAGGKDGKIPMAGVPYRAVDAYISKLVKAGYKVAICEQMSPPNKKGLVEREVIRIVTPGTVLDEKALEKKENNYIISLLVNDTFFSISVADISTGYFATFEKPYHEQTLKDELAQLNPAECILPEDHYNNAALLKLLNSQRGLNINCFHDFSNFAHDAKKFLKKHFGVTTLAGFGIDEKPLSQQTASALLGYLQNTQKNTVAHIKKITHNTPGDYVVLDKATIINLELFSTIREHDTNGSLLSVLDQTVTAMGGRMLKSWIKKPLAQKEAITQRHDAVAILLTNIHKRNKLRTTLQEIPDIERILSRLSVNIGNARDLKNLQHALEKILIIKQTINTFDNKLLQTLQKQISVHVNDVIKTIGNHIVAEPPIDTKSGGMIRKGVNKALDKLYHSIAESKLYIENLEKQEKEKTGITSLKVRFNKVFGYYIEVSRASSSLVPNHYMRKQTLVNGERYITEELKKHEEIILTAEEKINELEYTLFLTILGSVLQNITALQHAADAIAQLDCLLTFAHLAEKNNYVRPTLLYSGEIKMKEARHPVVEKLLEDELFVPNDVTLDNTKQQLLLITGPNMAGKSVFIRQVAVIVLMNQIGCFVPVKQAELSIVDRIFVRSGASDVITSGLSTFMVEMVETAHILHHATNHSLIVMDEIGRGTSTYDGISIAWAVAEYLVTHHKNPPKTLFATHYHELQTLEEQYPTSIKNYHMAVADEQGSPIFLHTLLPGGASHSFGVAVAKMAGVPEPVIEKAKEILHSLENRYIDDSQDIILRDAKNLDPSSGSWQTQDNNLVNRVIQKELASIDIGNMTPLEALNKLAELKDKLKLLHQTQNEKFLEAD